MGSLKTGFLTAALLLVAGSAIAQLSSNGFRFNDSADQTGFIEAVQKEGVEFSVRDDGTLIYNPADEERISRVRSKFLEDNFTPSAHFPNPALEAKVIAAFDSAHIPHGVRVREGKRYITWAEGDDGRAGAIVDAVIEARGKND